MRARLVVLPAVVAGLVLSLSGAEAATKTLDGKKVKSLSFSANGGAQDNDAWLAYDVVSEASQSAADSLPAPVKRVQPEDCKAPTCASLDFIYKPAKGIKGGLMFTAAWSSTASDIDLYVLQYERDGSKTEIGHCGQSGSTSEKVYIAPEDLKPGRHYAMVMQFFRSANETATGTVRINVPSTIPNTLSLPGIGDPLNLNCSQ
jgi:hypothetical protein